jgi:hypothetical protein
MNNEVLSVTSMVAYKAPIDYHGFHNRKARILRLDKYEDLNDLLIRISDELNLIDTKVELHRNFMGFYKTVIDRFVQTIYNYIDCVNDDGLYANVIPTDQIINPKESIFNQLKHIYFVTHVVSSNNLHDFVMNSKQFQLDNQQLYKIAISCMCELSSGCWFPPYSNTPINEVICEWPISNINSKINEYLFSN